MMQLREHPHRLTQGSSNELNLGTEIPAPRSVVYVRAANSWNKWSSCLPRCKCRCHIVQYSSSSSQWYKSLGVLFTGYLGYPFETAAACTEHECISRSKFRISVCYLFPSWFLSKAFIVTIMSVTQGEISASLTVKRFVPFSAEIVLLANSARANSVEGIKALFRSGLASPNDLDKYGGTLLRVSHALPLRCHQSHHVGKPHNAWTKLLPMLCFVVDDDGMEPAYFW